MDMTQSARTEKPDDNLYDPSLPSQHPFEWVEKEGVVFDHPSRGKVKLLAFGAYNAMGLIGSEKGGLALVSEEPKFVLGTQDVPFSMKKRARAFDSVSEQATAWAKLKPAAFFKKFKEAGWDMRE